MMNEVLELMLRFTLVTQSDLAHTLAKEQDLNLGTARAYTSASLLYFRQVGWVECVDPSPPSPWWRLTGE